MLLGCTDATKNQIQGTWNLVYFKWNYPDSTFFEYPGNIKICNGKMMLLDDNSLWYFRYKTNTDSVYTLEFGDMKYKFDGKIYQETYLSAQDDKFIGQTFHYNVTISNDTLTLTGPGDGEVDKLGCNVLEIFVREWDIPQKGFKHILTIDTLSQNIGFVTPRLFEPTSWNKKVPIMMVHAGKDFVPHTNESLTSFVSEAIVQNIPITLMIHSDGVHAFDINTDNESTRQIIKNTLEFWKFYLK